MHPVLRYLPLLPVLIPQAIGVGRGALKLPEAAGPRQGVIGRGPALRVRIIGDSSAAGVGVSDQSQALAGQLATALSPHCTVTWNLIAKTGATTASTLKRLNTLPPPQEKADVVITVLGVNDVTRAVGSARWITQQGRLIGWVKRHHDPALHYMTGLPPMGDFPLLPHPLGRVLGEEAARFDTALQTLCAAHPHTRYFGFDLPLDAEMMAEDGFHPGAEIYALLAKELASRILSDWPR